MKSFSIALVAIAEFALPLCADAQRLQKRQRGAVLIAFCMHLPTLPASLACRRFGGRRDKVFSLVEEQECREGSSAATSGSRQ